MLVWCKLASAKWEDAWVERLQFLGPTRLALFLLPDAKRVRIEAYALTEREGARLVRTFGGQLRQMKKTLPAQAEAKLRPLVIRSRLVVVRSERAAKAAARQYPGRAVLAIPAAMAFGTGDHATTSTCLRLLCDAAAGQPPGWEMLDLGTGTGILALAGRLLGAARCDAFDFDPACIRATRENAKRNGIRQVAVKRVDVLEWTPARQWGVVTANLYSEVLLKACPKVCETVRAGGRLILSGMLAGQAEETLRAFTAQGVKFQRVTKRGKWVTALSEPFSTRKRARPIT